MNPSNPPRRRNSADLKTAGTYIEDYHVLQTTKEEGVMRAIRNGLQGAGIPVENSKGEWGPGQEEINVRYADALDMADNHVILKNGVKEIAWSQGKSVTFMSKWNYGLAGSSSHVHASLWDAAGKTRCSIDPKAEYGMSPLMRSFVAGQLKYARDITYFLAPYINSYKRFQVGTFAPTKAVWSRDNRTAGFPALRGEIQRQSASNAASAAPISIRISPSRALLAAGLAGVRGEAEARCRRIPATLISARNCRKCRRPCATRPKAFEELQNAARRLRRRRGRSLCPHRELGAVRI